MNTSELLKKPIKYVIFPIIKLRKEGSVSTTLFLINSY
ncbi:hypothetical protein L1278_002774 [Pontibacter sp. HSC-36F09]|nr:hypothetical protein [Pontibacter sp. HSC-36F09]